MRGRERKWRDTHRLRQRARPFNKSSLYVNAVTWWTEVKLKEGRRATVIPFTKVHRHP